MRKRIQAIFILIATGAILSGVLLLLCFHLEYIHNRVSEPAILAGSLTIPVSIADSPSSREQGLSDTDHLEANSGKLFVFDTPGMYGFWMKDMHYSLDFVWIDTDMKIIGITPRITPNTFPQIFYPPSVIRYVLEVNSGFSDDHHLFIGEALTFQK